MTFATRVQSPDVTTRPASSAIVGSERRVLSVPMAGREWYWGWIARFGLIYSVGYFAWAVPIPPFRSVGLAVYKVTHFAEPWFIRFTGLEDIVLRGVLYKFFFPAVIATLWILLDRSRKHETVIHAVSRIVARFGLAAIMASYGLEKILGAQGSWAYEPEFMTEAYGTLIGGTTLMTWLAHSTWYEQFGGFVELTCTFLLVFPRTVTVGAILAMAALVNIAIVNTAHMWVSLAYVPWQYAVMAMVLLVPYAPRLIRFFTGRSIEPVPVGELVVPTWSWNVGKVLKFASLFWMLYSYGFYWMTTGPMMFATESPLDGLYVVERFERNGRQEHIASEFPNRWKEVAIGNSLSEITAKTVDGTRIVHRIALPTPPAVAAGNMFAAREAYFNARLDFVKASAAPEGELEVYGDPSVTRIESSYRQPLFGSKKAGKLRYTRTAPDGLTLEGQIDSVAIKAELRRIQLDTLPFHRTRWYPREWRAKISTWAARTGLIIY